MLLLLQKLGFPHNHNRNHMSEADLASLQAFRSHVSDHLYRAFESSKLEPDSFSLTWIHRCFRMLQGFNNAFAKLMVEIDYPVSSWKACSIDEYLDYSINLLDLLNSISSSLSHLNHARVSLSHALSLMERSPSLGIQRMREVKPRDSINEFNVSGRDQEGISSGKERIFHEAMMVLESTEYWICGVVLLGIKGDVKPTTEVMSRSRVVLDSMLMAMDSVTKKKVMEEGGFVKEVEGVNEMVRMIVSSGNGGSEAVVKELKRRLEVVGNGLKGLKDDEEDLFGKVMAARNEVLDTLRRNH